MSKLNPVAVFVLAILAGAGLGLGGGALATRGTPQWLQAFGVASAANRYIILGWNDLGMHCYNRNFQDLAVLPPYNNLVVQVLKVGDPPQVITAGITVSYLFTDNTYSAGKTDFWLYAQKLFGLPAPLPDNIGLTGRGLSGTLTLEGNYFDAVGIPLTEFSDSAPNTPQPFQQATIIVRDQATGTELGRQVVVAPVSTEMHCDYCHSDNGKGAQGIATGKVETNILTFHDREAGTNLMNSRPVLCASCHSSNALGAPGKPGIPSLSNAMHQKHTETTLVADGVGGCYNCHPGPNTRCLRDVMSSQFGMTCTSCHGTLGKVGENPNPWLSEPKCEDCHSGAFAQNQTLYRHSTGHGGLFCEACHDSTHAIAPSTRPADGIKFIALQGQPGPLRLCTTCHQTPPTSAGPHGLTSAVLTPMPTATPIVLQKRVYLPQIIGQ